MAKLIHKKIAASTLVEVLVALVIIMGVFVVASMIYINVASSGSSSVKLLARQETQRLFADISRSRKIPETELEIDGIRYVIEASASPNWSELTEVSIQALQNEREIYSNKRLINMQVHE